MEAALEESLFFLLVAIVFVSMLVVIVGKALNVPIEYEGLVPI